MDRSEECKLHYDNTDTRAESIRLGQRPIGNIATVAHTQMVTSSQNGNVA